jgi:UDP-glucose 4-epimerase
MRILLTGGTGFIGRNLREHLSREHEVLAPTHSELDLADNLAVDAWFRAHEVDAVVHGAVRPGHRAAQDPSRQLWSNLRMFFNIARNRDRFRRLVFLSSGAVYDTREPLVRVAENRLGASVPEDEHGLSKYAIAQFLEALGSHSEPRVVELRLFGVFGRYEDYGIRFISNAICRALCELPIMVRQDRRFSYLFVDDLMPVVDWALAGQPAHVAYNVSPDWTDSLRALGSLVSAHDGNGLPVVVASDGYGSEYTADNSRFRKELPHLQFTPPEVAIESMFSWYSDRLSDIDRKRLEIDHLKSQS